MLTLHVNLELKRGRQQELEKTYLETFRPAVCQQEGFRAVALLRPKNPANAYVLSIVFDDLSLQQKWVATDIHQQVWPQMESNFERYDVRYYDAI